MKTKSSFGIIVGTRGVFNPKLAEEGRNALVNKLESLGYGVVIPPKDLTNAGAVETTAEGVKYARFFQQRREELDGIIVSLPNFGDELGIVNALSEASLDIPVLVQAEDDDTDKTGIAQRRDAFCGKISVCNNLRQYGIPFSDTTEHTCKVAGEEFTRDIDRFARICRVARGLKHARIGQIGTRPGPFQTVRVSEKLLQGSGITVVPVDFSEILIPAQRRDADSSAVKKKIEEIKAYGKIPSAIPEKNIVKQAALTVQIEEWIAANNIDACAIQCWTSVEENYGCAVCVSMSMMGDALLPSACEADVGGVVSMYALTLASGNASALLDWNNNYGSDRSKCVCTHCSNFPKSFVANPIEISNLDVLGSSLGYENSFGAVKGKVAAGPMTYFRMDSDDARGELRAYLGEGDFTDDPFPMDGGIAVCRVNNLRTLLSHICSEGFEHHVGMTRGHWSSTVMEAVTKYLGWNVYFHS